MAKMFVEPEMVQQLIKRMDRHTSETQRQQKQLKGFIKNMQQQWNDAHYKAFTEQFAEFDKMMTKAMQMSETILIPNLKNVKKYADEYKNMGRR